MKTIYFGVKSALSILIVVLLILCCGSAAFGTGMTVFAAEAYTYQHDPTLNQSAMLDIAKDETAVYGFRPNDTGSLKQYADMDWTDAELVEQGRQDRIAYHQSIESMYALLYQMNYEQKSTEEIARAVSTKTTPRGLRCSRKGISKNTVTKKAPFPMNSLKNTAPGRR